MKKLKIFVLIAYILIGSFLITESFMNSTKSKKLTNFVSKIVSSITDVFIKNKYTYAKDIVIDEYDVFYTKNNYDLNAKVLPDNSSYKSLTYSSSNTEIATISSKGVLYFLTEGTVTITITQEESNLKKEFTVNGVTNPNAKKPIESISLYKSTYNINAGDVSKIGIKYVPETNYIYETKTYTSSNPEVVACYNGKMYALKEGSATITVKLSSGLEASAIVNVKPNTIIKPTNIEVDFEDTMIRGKKQTINVTIDDTASQIYKDVIIESSDTKVIYSNSNEEIIAKKIGKAKISIYTVDGILLKELEITVKNILPDFTVSNTTIVMGTSKEVGINILNEPTYSNFTYRSYDENIVTVDVNGIMTPKQVGETKIVVKCADGSGDYVRKVFKVVVEDRSISNIEGFNFYKFVRKIIGHFSCYFLFGSVGLCLYLLWLYKKKPLILCYTFSLSCGLFVSILTEIIQHYTPGRYGAVKDSLIDFSGYMLGSIVVSLVILIIFKCKKKKEQPLSSNDSSINQQD